jgi:hypothetical protein
MDRDDAMERTFSKPTTVFEGFFFFGLSLAVQVGKLTRGSNLSSRQHFSRHRDRGHEFPSLYFNNLNKNQ